MGTITAQTIIDKAQIVLQDTTAVRWSEPELLGWLNDGQREIVILRPDANATIANTTLVAGTLQTIPAGGYQLLGVIRNMGSSGNTPGRAVRRVDRDTLDSQIPDWHTAASSDTTVHFVFESTVPKRFYVYPPANAGQRLEISYSAAPADVAALGNTITLDDIYANPLTDYILYRAFSKDFEQQGTAAQAAAARQSFENTLGLKAASDSANATITASKG